MAQILSITLKDAPCLYLWESLWGSRVTCSAQNRTEWLGSLAVCLPSSNTLNLSDDCKPRLKPEACIRFHPALLWEFHSRHCLPAISTAASDSTPFKWQPWLRRELVWPDAVSFTGFPSSLSPPSYNVLYCFLFIALLLSLYRCRWKSTSLLLSRFLLDHFHPNLNSREQCDEEF